ncbi:cardiolipin synthase [Thermomonas sp.]|uniref:cardiolipin synthase n=1 Tax=Thermomonas sp. TaxID=1971895 RepID=UPI002607A00E|nr:cardiolipin synthase [Thermomonas sp.]
MELVLLQLWNAMQGIPHVRAWLAAGWMLYLLGLGVWIVLQKREPAATLSWLISLAVLPYLGFFIYYVFGPPRLTRHRARRRIRAGLPEPDPAPTPVALELRTLAKNTSGYAPTTACNTELLVDGCEKYPALLDAIARARHHVHLEYYILEPDRTGQAIVAALAERARAGVAVRLLLDAVGSSRARSGFFRPLRDAGGELAWFHPGRIWVPWRRPWVNLRTHRKLAIVDGAVGFIGGINLTDEEDPRVRPDAYRDLHLRMEGEIVRKLQDLFIDDWVYATGRREFIQELACAMPKACDGAARVQLLASGPDSPWEAIHRLHVHAIHAAESRVWLATPYFVPGEAAMMALTSSALGGLDVRLLVPKMSDSRLVTWCVRSYYDALLDAGVKVYEYGPRMLHSKALLVDDHLAIVGSANFDQRSFRLNFEASMLIDDAVFAEKLSTLLEGEIATAAPVRVDRAQPLLTRRLPEALARLLAPLL